MTDISFPQLRHRVSQIARHNTPPFALVLFQPPFKWRIDAAAVDVASPCNNCDRECRSVHKPAKGPGAAEFERQAFTQYRANFQTSSRLGLMNSMLESDSPPLLTVADAFRNAATKYRRIS